jgi:hypothetical protein
MYCQKKISVKNSFSYFLMALKWLAAFTTVKGLFIEPWAIPIWPKNWGALSLFTNDQVNPETCLESQSR